jgi:homopolymeric O-antigen transport system ATP-binding protein
MSDIAIDSRNLGKRYRLGLHRRGYGTLREALSEAARRAMGRQAHHDDDAYDGPEFLWALQDLSMTIRQGEVVGLIGHNGAGKSTLLKILSRITEPSEGYADVSGRVGSLLEVGTGFHPELTGRENIFLNGAILGMRRGEIRSRFDEIVEFAEIERFLDTPVKRYSSGMSVRLAFAVAAHLEPEILLVDEVLAVGDAAFQRKSLGKMTEVASQGRTVVFVSHNLAIIQALCERGILLEQGQAKADGPIKETIDRYLGTLEQAADQDLLERTDRDRRGYFETWIRAVGLRDPGGGPPDVVISGRPATITVELTEEVPSLECQLTIADSLGQAIATLDSENSAPVDSRDPSRGPCVECEIPSLPLLPGRYRIDVIVKAKRHIQDGLQGAAFFEVQPGVMEGRPVPPAGVEGSVVLPHAWRLPT